MAISTFSKQTSPTIPTFSITMTVKETSTTLRFTRDWGLRRATRVIARYGKRLQWQEVAAQSSFYSVNGRRLHFGLGPDSAGDLTVRWTSGKIESISNVAADQLVVIREGAGIIRTQKF